MCGIISEAFDVYTCPATELELVLCDIISETCDVYTCPATELELLQCVA